MKRIRVIKAYFYLTSYFLRLFFYLLYGIIKLSRMKQAPITILGGSRLPQDSSYREQAQLIAQNLTHEEIPVLVGGSSSYLETWCHQPHEHKHTIESVMAINVKSTQDQAISCIHNDMVLTHFSARKWILMSYSSGFIVFPGGIGTLSELTQLLTLIQTEKRRKAPIVLIGVAYWQPLLEWLKNYTLTENLIKAEHLELFSVTDSLAEAVAIIKQNYRKDFAV